VQIKHTFLSSCLVVVVVIFFLNLHHPKLDAPFILFLKCLLQLQMKIETFTKSQDPLAKEISNALVVKAI